MAHGRRQVKADGANQITANFLRQAATESERALWQRLSRGVGVYRFRQQVPLFGYVVDFYCPRLRLVVEVDGSWHAGRQHHDQLREDVLRANHQAIVRITSNAVTENLDSVMELIRGAIEARARSIDRPQRHVSVPTPPEELCRHQDDPLLCERCKLVNRALRQRSERSDEDAEATGRSPRGSGGTRFSELPGLVNRPPADPGSLSKQGF